MSQAPNNFSLPLARSSMHDLPGSLIRDVANAGMGRGDVLPFWFGESSEATDAHITDAAIASLRKGETFYSHNLGLAELREAYAAYVNGVHRTILNAENIAITSAGVSALMIAVQALVSPGDEVVVVEPVWPNLPGQARVMSAQLKTHSLQVKDGKWQLDLDALIASITPRTRMVMINSPNNPTGFVMPAHEQQRLLEHCRSTGTWILSDEVYHRLYFSENRENSSQVSPSFLEYATSQDRLVVVHSFSKSFWMTGWRLGALIAPRELMVTIGKLAEFNTSCAPVFVQRAGMAALANAERYVQQVRSQLEAARPVLLSALKAIPNAIAPVPEGAMYVYFKLAGFDDSLTLAKRLVAEAGLGLAPGAAFGKSDPISGELGEGWLRWCYAGAPERVREGAVRLSRWLEENP